MPSECRGLDGGYEGFDPEEVAERVADEGIVFTKGVSSAVLDGEDAVGHVLLLDCDGVDALTAHKAAAAMSGVTALLESSSGSYHVWNLTVRPWEDAILEGLSWRVVDSEHVAQSYRRDRYVLRAFPKVHGDGEVYKSAPRLLEVYVDLERDEDGEPLERFAQSRPHLLLLEGLAERPESEVDPADVPDVADVPTVGPRDGLAVDSYMTLTDDAKDRLRRSE